MIFSVKAHLRLFGVREGTESSVLLALARHTNAMEAIAFPNRASIYPQDLSS